LSYMKSVLKAEYLIKMYAFPASLSGSTLACHTLYFLGMGWRSVPMELRPLMRSLPVTWYRSRVSNLRPAVIFVNCVYITKNSQ
jgi:hypothetical protein